MTETQKKQINKKFATFLREKRTALGMTQKELSIHIFGDESRYAWISAIENGRGITLDTMDTILSALNCSIEFKEDHFIN